MSPRLRLMYGGTFDPFHLGHLHIARWARDHARADVYVTPAADPPHRGAARATALQRLDMVQLAVYGEPNIAADPRELKRNGPSYTVDTLRELREELGARAPIGILLGMDSFLSLPTWYQWRSILDLAHIVVAERPGEMGFADMSAELTAYVDRRIVNDAATIRQAPAGQVLALKQPLNAISATAIRRDIDAGGDAWKSQVEPAVAQYILRHGLYGSAAAAVLE